MALKINSQDIATVKFTNATFNSVDVSEVKFNGTTVWTSDAYIHFMPCDNIKELPFSVYICPGEGLLAYSGMLVSDTIKIGDVIKTENTSCSFTGDNVLETPYNYEKNTGWTSWISLYPNKGEIVSITPVIGGTGNYMTYRKGLTTRSVTVEGYGDNTTFVNNTSITIRVNIRDGRWITLQPQERYNTYDYSGDPIISFHDANYGYQILNHTLNKKPLFWGDRSKMILYIKNSESSGTFSIAKLNSDNNGIESWVQKGFYLGSGDTKSFSISSKGSYVAFEGNPSDSSPDTGPWMCCKMSSVKYTKEVSGTTDKGLMNPDGQYWYTAHLTTNIGPGAENVSAAGKSGETAWVSSYDTKTGEVNVTVQTSTPLRPGKPKTVSAIITYYR